MYEVKQKTKQNKKRTVCLTIQKLLLHNHIIWKMMYEQFKLCKVQGKSVMFCLNNRISQQWLELVQSLAVKKL